MFKKLSLLIFSLIVCTSPLASNSWHTSEIKRLYPLENGDFIFTFKTPSTHCQRNDDYHYVRDGLGGVTSEGLKSMYSSVLAAELSGKSVSAIFDSTSSSCHVSRLYVEFE